MQDVNKSRDKGKKRKKKMLSLILMIYCILLLGRYYSLWQDSHLYVEKDGTSCTVSGRIIWQRQTDKGYEYYLKGKSIRFENQDFHSVHLTFQFFSPENIKVNSDVEITARLSFFGLPKNKGDWNQRNHFKAKNIYHRLSKVQIQSIKENPASWLIRLKDWVRSQSLALLPTQEAGLFLSLVAGDRSDLDGGIREDFQKLGVSHVLAVSGLHVGLLLLFLNVFLKKLPLPYGWQFAIIGMVFCFYLLFTGGQASTTRAVLMFVIMEAAYFFDRAKDAKRAYITCLLLLLLYNPYYIYDIGFLLSFTTIAGLLFLHPFLFAKKKKWVQILGITVVSQIVLLPLFSLYFYRFSFLAFITNLWMIPVVSFFLGMSGLALIVSSVSLEAAHILIGSAYYLMTISLKIADWLSKLSFADVPIRSMNGWEIMLFYGVILAALLWKNKRILFGLAFSVFIFIPYSLLPQLSMLDVGQAESMLLTYRNYSIVVDVGLANNRSLAAYLSYLGRDRVDFVLLSHLDKDHAGGLQRLLEKKKVSQIGISSSYFHLDQELAEEYGLQKVYQSYQELLALADEFDVPVTYWEAGDRIEIDDLELLFVYPGRKEIPFQSNDFSSVIEMNYRGAKTLLTGDISREVEEILLERNAVHPLSVLKVAHHGSKYSSADEFLEKSQPALAIISCGRYNRYGHPSEDLIKVLKEQGVVIRVTAWDGQICLHYTKKGEVILDE